MQFVAPSPYCHFETKRNSRLIGSRQDYIYIASHVISFIIGVSVATGSKGRRASMCVSHNFLAPFCMFVGRPRFNVDISLHFAIQHVSEVNKRNERERELFVRVR